ncbi:MAG: hypothetical protein J6U21_10155 [Bacteroidales bacterium]|nr:hypothetical protein [Bacteroidales bacterium]
MAEKIKLEYKGYTAVCEPNPNDRGRLYGRVYPPDNQFVPLEHWLFTGGTSDEVYQNFKTVVEKVLEHKSFNDTQEDWVHSVDYHSIRAVFNILPDEFERRIDNGYFDKSLLNGVKGGDYVVPLFYVPKAWDVLLKNSLGLVAFKIGPEEDAEEADYENELSIFMEEHSATRTRRHAIEQNDKIKEIWKNKIGIDIDEINVDFKKFNMHIPPHVSEDEFYHYFTEVPDGVDEWIMYGINKPEARCTFHAVSCLMEFTAAMQLGFYEGYIEQTIKWRRKFCKLLGL